MPKPTSWLFWLDAAMLRHEKVIEKLLRPFVWVDQI